MYGTLDARHSGGAPTWLSAEPVNEFPAFPFATTGYFCTTALLPLNGLVTP
uniref:Uncharacterized protein n=1 Tax=Mycobacterium riyadhense TaxID=486698 RepID=A0A653F452_9MYCO|nr:hypothetical protein BIN_B_05510 [Mycobacterium riyadhense]